MKTMIVMLLMLLIRLTSELMTIFRNALLFVDLAYFGDFRLMMKIRVRIHKIKYIFQTTPVTRSPLEPVHLVSHFLTNTVRAPEA